MKNCLIYDDINESGGLYKRQIELVSFLCDEFESYISNHKDKALFDTMEEYLFRPMMAESEKKAVPLQQTFRHSESRLEQ